MNRRIRLLAVVLMGCYLSLFVKLNFLQAVNAAELNAKPDNGRKLARDFNQPRGDIVAADGTVLATSVESDGRYRYQRTYPTDDLFAHIVGSYSFLFGSDGVEAFYNDELSGKSDRFRFNGYLDPLYEAPNVGRVDLTVRPDVQAAAREALGERPGSVVVLDPNTGAILAMWTFPSYNPNFTSNNDATIARAFKEAYNVDAQKPLLAKTYRERFFPGSTFKVVTASAGLDSGKVTADTPDFERAENYEPPSTGKPISNFDGSTCGGTLFSILRVSCNSAFAEMGAELLGPQAMIDEAEQFGFNQDVPIDLPRPAKSVFPTDFGREVRPSDEPGYAPIFEDTATLAQAAIGQNDVSATPLQMAMVAGAVGTAGSIMTPHVLDQIRDRKGRVIEDYQPEVWRSASSVASAATLKSAMIGVVEDGTADAMAIRGVEVGGKTGTAQLGSNPPRSHAWVIGFAGPPGGVAQVAVAVIVEGQRGASEQTGGKVAAPIAQRVLEVALRPVEPQRTDVTDTEGG